MSVGEPDNNWTKLEVFFVFDEKFKCDFELYCNHGNINVNVSQLVYMEDDRAYIAEQHMCTRWPHLPGGQWRFRFYNLLGAIVSFKSNTIVFLLNLYKCD